MALTDNAVIYPNQARVLYDLAGTAGRPTLAQLVTYAGDVTTPPTGFTDLGHTTADKIVSWGSEGGETEVKGSLQNNALRQILTSQAVDYFTVRALQLRDNQVLKFYYGGGDVSVNDVFGTPDVAVLPQITAMLVIMDDNGPFAAYMKLCSVRREDSISMPNDNFAEAPLRFTPLKASGTPKIQWIGDGLGT